MPENTGGNENPIGKIITSDEITSKITHVFADLPRNSHLRYDVLQSDDIPSSYEPEEIKEVNQTLWAVDFYTYLIMSEDYDVRKFKDIIGLIL